MATSVIKQHDPSDPFPILTIPANEDLDNWVQTGFYYVPAGSASTGSHMPTTSAFNLLVFNRSSNSAVQLAVRSGEMFTRAPTSSGWTTWKKYTGT